MIEQLRLTWDDYGQAVDALAPFLPPPIDGLVIFGMPRGGLTLAVGLSHASGIPMSMIPVQGMILVDDICDTGATLDLHNKHFKPTRTLAWVLRTRRDRSTEGLCIASTVLPVDDDRWVVFPWERPERAALDRLDYVARR